MDTAASMEVASGLDTAGFGAETTGTASDLALGLDIVDIIQAPLETLGFGTAGLDSDTPGFTGRFDLFDRRK